MYLKSKNILLNQAQRNFTTNDILTGGYKKRNGKVMLVDFNKENLRHVILDDFSRALDWTGMLASAVDNSLDDEEEPQTEELVYL